MKIYDISVPLRSGMIVYPGDPPVVVERVHSTSTGDSDNLSSLAFGSHAGTHIDAPRHFIDNGVTVDHLPLEVLIGEALVVEMEGPGIGPRQLSGLRLGEVKRVLFKTSNSKLWMEKSFVESYTYLTEEGARYLAERGVLLVAIDYLSIERYGGTGDVHKVLLEAGVVILEGVDLEQVPPGRYELICLPLKLEDGDGAPARAVLRSVAHGGHEREFEPHTTRWPLS